MKKKILALLLTVMTVALLVPAVVASALAPIAAGAIASAESETVDDRAEVATHDPLLPEDRVEVLNKNGVRVGYYNTLAEAVADLREGDTVNLLGDIEISATVKLSGSFVLNGNGFVISYGEADPVPEIPQIPEDGGAPSEPDNDGDIEGPTVGGEVVDPENPENPENSENENGDLTVVSEEDDTQEVVPPAPEMPAVALSVIGENTNVVIKNLMLSVPEIAMGVQLSSADLTLQNCVVSAAEVAIAVQGANAYLNVKGIGGNYFAENSAITVSGGFADIYGGSFLAGDKVITASNATVAVYDGLFEASGTLANVVSALSGATVVLAGGEYATAANSTEPLLYTENGEIKILDGKYYQSGAEATLLEGDGFDIYDGFFYGQTAAALDGVSAGEGYAVKTYSYEDPTFPANTKLDVVKELGYYHMSEVTYDDAWLAANGYSGTTYDVTNGVHNEYPVSYYAFELERAFWYLGNGGALTLMQDVTYEQTEALNFRQRPQSSVVTLNSAGKGDNAFMLCVDSAELYALVVNGGSFELRDLKLMNRQGKTILVQQADGAQLNLLEGAVVAGYQEHAIMVGAYATVNMYDGSYVHAAAGLNGERDGNGFGVVTLIGGELNVYGGNLGYARELSNGGYVDEVATGLMNTVAVGVASDSATCVSNINVYNGKLGKSSTNLTTATALINLTEQSERIDGTKVYIENGEFNSAMNSIIRCGDRNVDVHIKGGAFNGPTVTGTNIGHSDLICVNGLSADVHNRLIIEGGSFSGGRDQINIRGYAAVSVSNSYHTGGMSAIFSLLGNPEAAPITVTDITVETTVTAFWCESSALIVNGGLFNINRSSWGEGAYAIAGNAATAGNVTVTGGVYNIGNGYLTRVTGTAVRTVTLNDITFNSAFSGGSGICLDGNGCADVIVNGGVYSNMISANHQIETWGNIDTGKSTLTINGDAQFLRGGTASGRMIKFYGANNVTINGGYFYSRTSEAIVIEKSSDTKYPTGDVIINGGTFFGDTNYSLIYMGGVLVTTDLVINGGTFTTNSMGWGACLDVGGSGSTNIYGGTFASMAPNGNNGSDACISVNDGICNIYAGTFRANGMCVARGLAGKTDGETNVNGSIQTVANSRLNIYGGVFTLEANAHRASQNAGYDAVIRCGGGSTYAFVSIYGGTFISNSTHSNQVISKNNVHSSINITGCVILASSYQKNYYKTNGMANTGGTQNPSASIAVGDNDPVVNFGGNQYKQHVIGTGASPFNGKMEKGAQIRLDVEGDSYVGGLRFVTRYSSASVASLKSLAGGSLENVSFGTLIVKAELVAGMLEVSHASLLDKGIDAYWDIAATNGISGSEADGFTVTAAVSNIAEADYATSYAAIGYVKLLLGDSVLYFYTEYVEENNARSIAQVAEAALNDVRDDQTHGYVFEHITLEGKYSRYTPEQQAVMQTFIPTPEVAE